MDMWWVVANIAMVAGAIYPIFQVKKSIKHKNAFGLSKGFLLTWMVDRVFTLALMIHLANSQMSIKYSFSLICLLVVVYYKFYGRNRDEKPINH